MCASTITAVSAYLTAKYVDGDEGRAAVALRQAKATYSNLRRSLRGLESLAPNRAMWAMEYQAISTLIGEVTAPLSMLLVGAPYNSATEERILRNVVGLSRGLFTLVSPLGGSALIARPGGAFERKIYLGSAVVGPAVVNWYLNLHIKPSPDTNAGLEVTVATDGTASGKEQPPSKGGPTAEVTSTDSGTSAKVSTGDSAAGGKASLEGGAEGPKLTIEGDKSLGGGATVTNAGSIGKDGPEVKSAASGGGMTTEATAGSSGIAASVSAEAAGWKNSVMGDADGISVSSEHKGAPGSGGVNFSISLDRASLTALAPELDVAGMVAVQAGLTMEIVPGSFVFAKSMTQTEAAIRTYQATVLALAAVSLAVIATGGVAAAGAAAAPAVVTASEQAAVWLAGGAAVSGAAGLPVTP